MTQQPEKTKPSTRGAILGQLIASQRLQSQGVQQSPAEAQVGQGQLFNLQSIGSQVDTTRGRFRTSSGWQPGFFMTRFQGRQAERLRAVTTQRNTLMAVNSEPEDKKTAEQSQPAPQPALTCPWANEGCTFKTDSPQDLQSHVALHTRSQIRTY